MEMVWRGGRFVVVRGKRVSVAMEPDEVAREADVVTFARRRPGLGPCVRIGQSRVLSGPGEFDASGVSLVGIQMGSATAFSVHVEGLTVCHLGALEPERLAEIGSVDVLLAPLGADGLSVGQAVEAVAQLEPRVVVPLAEEPEAVEALCKQLGAAIPKTRGKLTLTADGFPEARQVILLEAPRTKRAGAA